MRRDDLRIEQGATWSYSWPIDVEGSPVDLSGWTARGQIRSTVESPDVLHEWTSDDDTALLTGSAVTLQLTPADTSAWTWSDGVYDVELTDPAGRVARVAQGAVLISREVTRP